MAISGNAALLRCLKSSAHFAVKFSEGTPRIGCSRLGCQIMKDQDQAPEVGHGLIAVYGGYARNTGYLPRCRRFSAMSRCVSEQLERRFCDARHNLTCRIFRLSHGPMNEPGRRTDPPTCTRSRIIPCVIPRDSIEHYVGSHCGRAALP